jgi:putative ABC transport system permease protein
VERGNEEAKVTEFGASIVGFAIGLIAASALVQLMKALLFGVRPLDPWTFITVPLVLTAAAVLASHLPASRASRLDPVVALRYE